MLPVITANEGDVPPLVTRVGSDVYFYADVTPETSLELIKLLKEVDSYPQWDVARSGLRPITLHINSPGGYMMNAMALADIIANLDSHTISIIEGYCASAATYLSLACDERYITKNSFMLIHQLSTSFEGTFEEWQDSDKVGNILMEKARTFYAEHSNLSKKKITKLLKRDYWMDAEEATAKGFVDKII